MGWFDDPDECEPAVQDALRIARGRDLPAMARSRTRAEYFGRYRKLAIVSVASYLAIGGVILLGLALEGGQENHMILKFAVPMLAIGLLIIYLVIRWRMKRNGTYRDPGIAVEVGADGIIVRGAGGDHGMRWHEIDATPAWVTIKSGVHFIGLWLQSPLGLVQLNDENYYEGRIAAALIVRGMLDDYHARQRARIERIG